MPEPVQKADSSSSSDEKEDRSAEVEEWKRKYEEMSELQSRTKSDFESFKRKTISEIEELNISITNLEKRNVELKLLLHRNNIEITESPQKSPSASRDTV